MAGIEIRVRESQLGDREWISRMLSDAWCSPLIGARGRRHNALDLPGLVAEVEGRPAGLLTYVINSDECEIVTLNALLAGGGVGSRLIESIIAIARRASCRHIRLVTSNDNLPALRFYQRKGFQIVAVHPNAIDRTREWKPEIPLRGLYGIPLRDEIELDLRL